MCVRPWPQSLHGAECRGGEQRSVRTPRGGSGSGKRGNHGPKCRPSLAASLKNRTQTEGHINMGFQSEREPVRSFAAGHKQHY